MMKHLLLGSLVFAATLAVGVAFAAEAEESAAILKAATLYASFDEEVKADFGGGGLTFSTRFTDEKDKDKFIFEKGFDAKAFRIAKDKGVRGGALEAVDVLPRNGRIFLPAKGNLAYKKDGWSGTLSVWINTDPNTLLKTKFCDPIQITHKGAHNGGIWFDFNDAKPRDMRFGCFTALATGQQPVKEEDPKAPMVRVPRVAFKVGEWRHIVLTWKNLDTGKKDSLASLYIDGKHIGDVKDNNISMAWDLEQAGIYVAVNYIGLLDELALFNRALTTDEIAQLRRAPALLAPLKGKKP